MEIVFVLDRIVETESEQKEGLVKTIKLTLKQYANDADLQLTAKFEDEIPSEWKAILGSRIGDTARVEIGPEAQQTTLNTSAEEEATKPEAKAAEVEITFKPGSAA